MKIHKLYIVIGLVLAFGMFFELAAHADETDQKTAFTFSEPFQVPGRMLPAGTYLFETDRDNSNIVRVFNANGTILEAQLLTIAAEREMPDKTSVTLANAEPGNPNYVVKWFYPGDTEGHEFIYPKQQQQQIAQDAERTVVAAPANSGAVAAGD
jgi:hypothetical protein